MHVEKNPSESHLNRGTPMYERALCVAAHAPDVPNRLRRALKRSPKSDKALHRAEKLLFENHFFKALVETTQAIDLIQGGVKTNALPESAWAVVNHRIATDRSDDVCLVKRKCGSRQDLCSQFCSCCARA